MMKRSIFLLFLLVIAAGVFAQRQTECLDEGWRFAFGDASSAEKDFGCGTEYFNYLTKAASLHNEGPYAVSFNDSTWAEVRIPHDWASALPYAEEASHSHGYKTVGYKYPETSVGWYRKRLSIPESALGQHLELRFNGIFRSAQVWFNGIFMGQEPSGYATQVYDITDYINYGGDNLICVRADATLEEGWFYEGAGIYRDVWLVSSSPVHVPYSGTFVYSELNDDFSTALLTIETDIENSSLAGVSCDVRTMLLDADGNIVAKANDSGAFIEAKDKAHLANIKISLDNPHLWDTADPYLYTVRTEVLVGGEVADTYLTRTGIRKVEFTADKGFFLNGRNIKLKGVNMHQDHAGVGSALPEALMRWRIKQIKAFGANAYRASHNPMTPAQLDICDEEGILVIDENRLMGTNDYHRRLLENFIRRDRNHPSVILWSTGNEEWGLESSPTGERIAASMREITRRLDPTRHSTVANAGGTELIKGADVVGYNYIIQNDVINRRNEHPDRKIVGTEETTGCGTRGVYFNIKDEPGQMASLNRIPADSLYQPDCDPSAARNTPGPYTQGIERGWQFYRDTPWAAGCFFWTGFDYRGEPNPLKYPAHDSQFGLLDYCGFPKDEAFYLKAAWTDEPTLHILPHWNLFGHEGDTIDVWVYSNCEEVALSVNGKNLGRQAMPKDGHLTWKAVYQPGKVTATGYVGGKKVLVETVETTDRATQINAHADRTTLLADGRDVAIVNIDLVDKKGRFVPDACPNLVFSLEGEGRIIGAGNGDPACSVIDHPEDIKARANESTNLFDTECSRGSAVANCKTFAFPAFNGHAQVLVQTTKAAGDIRLVCSGEGLRECAVDLVSTEE
ncbi:MAG: DUF4982 domain-containing protein [Prevotella sp.]|nr:DUF4982 domain-containing protein [Prevotella sp.]